MRLNKAFKIIAVPTQKNCLKNTGMGWFAFWLRSKFTEGSQKSNIQNHWFNIICSVILQKEIEVIVLEDI